MTNGTAEAYFENWMRKTLQVLEIDDWRVPIVHREHGHKRLQEMHPDYARLIAEWDEQGITATPDYLLKAQGRAILWIDVKQTQPPIHIPFNLNATKYYNYLKVSADTHVPAAIVVFTDKDFPMMWGYLLRGQNNRIPLEDIQSLELELRRLANL